MASDKGKDDLELIEAYEPLRGSVPRRLASTRGVKDRRVL
jgi:hypothetical protein